MEKKEHSKLTEKRLQKVRRASIRKFFDLVDRDRRGSIRKEDVWGGISNIGLESVLDLSEVEKMFEDVEKDSQGYARIEDLVVHESSESVSSCFG